MPIAERTGLKRKTIKTKVIRVNNIKRPNIIRTVKKQIPIAKRTGLKRKIVHKAGKKYINPLNAEKVTCKNYLKPLEAKENSDKQWQQTMQKANDLIKLMEYEPVYSNKYPVIDLSLQDARNYELNFVNRRIAV